MTFGPDGKLVYASPAILSTSPRTRLAARPRASVAPRSTVKRNWTCSSPTAELAKLRSIVRLVLTDEREGTPFTPVANDRSATCSQVSGGPLSVHAAGGELGPDLAPAISSSAKPNQFRCLPGATPRRSLDGQSGRESEPPLTLIKRSPCSVWSNEEQEVVMPNTALKLSNAPLPETNRQPHFAFYPICNDANEAVPNALRSPGNCKRKNCCDKATD